MLIQVDSKTPYAIITFLPEHELKHVPSPSFQEMKEAFEASKDVGLKNVKLANLGRFMKNMEEYEVLFQMGAV